MEHASYGRRMIASLIDGALIALVFAAIFLVAKSTVDYAFPGRWAVQRSSPS
jgi:hypothetical protein